MNGFDPLLTSSYDFHLPDERIAIQPAEPRDSAKLLVYDRKTDRITHTYFYNLEQYLPDECALLFNDTKVIKARLYGTKKSGGKIELLINKPLDAYIFSVYIKGRVTVGSILLFNEGLSVVVDALQEDGSRHVTFFKDGVRLRFEALLPIIEKIGHIPLPPYLARADNPQDEEDYQSVFAMHSGAVAAPTASLHFTAEQHQRICSRYKYAYLTLHVGAGTFKPVQADIITEHPMHGEYYEISDDACRIIDSSTPILSVGTTATRTIEYYVRSDKQQRGEANLFLHPGNKPQRVDHLLTNFHLPKSTLLMLVASFVGLEKTLELYEDAVKHHYRFYSYGDAMLIL